MSCLPSGAGGVTWQIAGSITERLQIEVAPVLNHFGSCTPCFGITPEDKCAEGSTSFMAYIHAIAAGHLEWTLCAISLLVSVLPDELLLIIRRLGFGRRGFGRGFGSFRMLRILFALLFTTVLGPIVLVALITFIAYRFFTSRRGR